MSTPSPAQMERWATLLRKASVALNDKVAAANYPGVVTAAYDDIRGLVNQVADEMYRAHDQAAEEAWNRVREVARRDAGAA